MSAEIIPLGMPEPGEEIEVIVRYRGQEYTITHGVVETVSLDREITAQRWSPFGIGRYESSGIETLKIVVRR